MAGDGPLTAARRWPIFQTLPEALVILDVETAEIADVNDPVLDLFGVSREEVVGHTIATLGIDESTVTESLHRFREEGTVQFEWALDRRETGSFPLEVTLSRFEFTGDEYVLATLRDLTARRDGPTLHDSMVRHDVRNELQLAKAYVEELEGDVDESTATHLEPIRECLANATDLTATTDGLGEAPPQADREVGLVPLQPALTTQLEEVRATFPQATVTLEGSIPEVTVNADGQLETVFRNLLRNAILHNENATPTVRVSVDRLDGLVEVRVADNGPGVPDEKKRTVFDRGVKGGASRGSGLGLHLVRSLVEAYDGGVWIEDNEPEGAVFVVRLLETGE